ncbi:uncharacterized protein RCC_07031 [Ramularia collo-cygni]|uniref:Uncharacterized protein n=1 Tax=Ramularia collo-cygni TaxID=112498 RepID=A0A2D3V6V3_9PEZI|nr:uncharacterized protein RCC_07031 [Ramularia collo-cygni]CZT21170.1 uncharacterized protein RCC_07031 [Ramularia collo-cygni]
MGADGRLASGVRFQEERLGEESGLNLAQLYEKHLWIDEDKLFSLEPIFGGSTAYGKSTAHGSWWIYQVRARANPRNSGPTSDHSQPSRSAMPALTSRKRCLAILNWRLLSFRSTRLIWRPRPRSRRSGLPRRKSRKMNSQRRKQLPSSPETLTLIWMLILRTRSVPNQRACRWTTRTTSWTWVSTLGPSESSLSAIPGLLASRSRCSSLTAPGLTVASTQTVYSAAPRPSASTSVPTTTPCAARRHFQTRQSSRISVTTSNSCGSIWTSTHRAWTSTRELPADHTSSVFRERRSTSDVRCTTTGRTGRTHQAQQSMACMTSSS